MTQPSWIGYKLNNRYEIEQELGSGGMSAVYKANDPNLKRVVAIKLIHPHLSKDTEFVRRFEIEAAAVAQLRHPNIVQVYDFDHDGDTYYMVLEFVPGETLQQRLQRLNNQGRKFTIDEVINLAAKTCDAVDYAHKRGLVHRDIKPANLMINVQADPVLMDFGIVKIVGEKQHTATGAVVGTALYMSPEQIRGERPDFRADIYSLGVLLYEMFSGKPPYDADSAMTIMMMHLNDPIPDILSLAPGTPPAFKRIIEKALAKNPADRFQSAGELAAAIRSANSPAAASSAFATGRAAGTMIEPPARASTYAEPAQPQRTYLEQSAAPPPRIGAPPPATRAPGATSVPRQAPAKKAGPNKVLLLGGGAAIIVLLLCVILAIVFLPDLLGTGDGGNGQTAEASATEVSAAVVVASDTPAPTLPLSTDTPVIPTNTSVPTETPTATSPPTATLPTGPFVLITDIQIQGGFYSVTYEAFNFDPLISSIVGTNHIHFFWNIYDPLTVGTNGVGDSTGGGSWVLYDKPNPFAKFAVSSRPGGATQMCALVAYHDHSIDLATGNCFDLPAQ